MDQERIEGIRLAFVVDVDHRVPQGRVASGIRLSDRLGRGPRKLGARRVGVVGRNEVGNYVATLAAAEVNPRLGHRRGILAVDAE